MLPTRLYVPISIPLLSSQGAHVSPSIMAYLPSRLSAVLKGFKRENSTIYQLMTVLQCINVR